MDFGKMDDFSLSDLAGSTAIILASCGGLLTVIFSSRCLIKCRLGLTDDCNICMCSREPPKEENAEQKEELPKKKDKPEDIETGVTEQLTLPRVPSEISIN